MTSPIPQRVLTSKLWARCDTTEDFKCSLNGKAKMGGYKSSPGEQ